MTFLGFRLAICRCFQKDYQAAERVCGDPAGLGLVRHAGRRRWGGMSVINNAVAPHYLWGDGCHGWVLAPSGDLLVIREMMPARTAEQRHFHSKARQFFFTLQGQLTMELDGNLHSVPAMSGIEIAPGIPHQARNDSEVDVHFLVVSTPTTRGDRTDIE